MDPISVLSLVCNVVELIDFGSKVVSETRTVYKAADSATDDTVTLTNVTTDLTDLTRTLRKSLRDTTTGALLSADAQALEKLGIECAAVADELQKLLSTLYVVGKPTRWKALRVVYRSVRARRRKEDVMKRLQLLREQFNLRIVADMRRRLVTMDTEHQIVFNSLTSHMKTLADDILTQRSCFAQRNISMSDLHLRALEYLREDQRLMEIRIMNFLQTMSSDQGVSSKDVKEMKAKIDRRTALRSLWYTEMHWRQEGIEEAYEDTFKWIFDEKTDAVASTPWDSFVNWLEEGNTAFWINGKAGSGKSTLMNFLVTESRTAELLRVWAPAQEYDLIKASFFFWNSGSDLQKSYAGLLRSLLHQCLSKLEELIPTCLEPAEDETDMAGWSERSLREAFRRLMQTKPSTTKICLFIDGLDELAGDTNKPLDFIREINDTLGMKVCVSSRPAPALGKAFYDAPQLRLQDLTRSDIARLAVDRLRNHKAVRDAGNRDLVRWEIEGIVSDLCAKADGVFLWVNLVVQSLWEGLEHEDDRRLLRARFDAFPSEVSGMYRHQLETLHPLYRKQAFWRFRLMHTAGDAPCLLDLFFAEEVDLDTILKHDARSQYPRELQQALTRYARQIQIRSAGLITLQCGHAMHQHIQRPKEHGEIDLWDLAQVAVTFSHLTVREYLDTQAAQPEGKIQVPEMLGHPSPGLAMVGSLVLYAKMRPTGREEVIALCRRFASMNRRSREPEDVDLLIRLMEELDKTLAGKMRVSKEDVQHLDDTHWSNIWPRNAHMTRGVFLPNDNFLDFCAETSHTNYVIACISRCEAAGKAQLRQRMLCFTLKMFGQTRGSSSYLQIGPSLDLIGALLEAGADPNLPYADCGSVWHVWLDELDTRGAIASQYTVDLTALLLKHGADVHYRLTGNRGEKDNLREDRGFDFNVAEVVEWRKDWHVWWKDEYLVQMRALLRSYGAVCREVVLEYAPHTCDDFNTRPARPWKLKSNLILPH